MIIDAHCHLMPPEFAGRHHDLAARDATFAELFPQPGSLIADADELLRDMDTAGIDRAVVMGFGWTDAAIAVEVNDYLLQAARAHPDRLSAFASVNPVWGAAAVDEARRSFDLGAVGIGELHADTQQFEITNFDVLAPLMDELLRWNLSITIHASEPVGHLYPGKGATTPERLLVFARHFPDNRIVLAHLGGGLPFYAAMPEVSAALKNVWYDTAAVPFLYRSDAIRAAVATAGAEHILFGTDYPLLRHRRVVDYVRDAGLGRAEHDAIMSENAASLLGLAPA